MTTKLTVKSFKHPNHLHYEWPTTLLQETDDFLVVSSAAGRRLKHYTKGQTFTIELPAIEIFSKTEWFTASLDIQQGRIVSAYCNIAKPSQRIGDEIHFVDFDVDYVKRPDQGWTVVDEDEFIENSKRYSYTPELIERVYIELSKLMRRVETKQFPFNEGFLESVPSQHVVSFMQNDVQG